MSLTEASTRHLSVVSLYKVEYLHQSWAILKNWFSEGIRSVTTLAQESMAAG